MPVTPEARPLTPEQAAERWGCSVQHVRNLIHRGELRAFRLGSRLFRIRPEDIAGYEQCQTTDSAGSREDGPSPGGPMESGGDIVLLVQPRRMPNAKPSTSSGENETRRQGRP